MTVDEALDGEGRIVIYDPGFGAPREEGTLVGLRVGSDKTATARVRYSHNDASIKATPLDKLSFLGGS